MQSFSKSNLPEGDWFISKKKVLTRIIEVQGSFRVVTINGDVHCDDGFVGLDEAGYPYPIERDVFFRSYDISNIYGLEESLKRDSEKMEEDIDRITHSQVVQRGVPATTLELASLDFNEIIRHVESFLDLLREIADAGKSEGVSGDPAGGKDPLPDK